MQNTKEERGTWLTTGVKEYILVQNVRLYKASDNSLFLGVKYIISSLRKSEKEINIDHNHQ